MSDSLQLDRDVVLQHGPAILSCQVGNDTVLLDSAGGRYYSLDEVGGRIFELVGAGRSLGAIHEALVAAYDATPDLLWSDLVAFCTRLATLGLVVDSRS